MNEQQSNGAWIFNIDVNKKQNEIGIIKSFEES